MAEYIDREEAKVWIANAISLIPSADVQPVTWIPVTERLPEEKGNYLVVFDCGYGAEVHESFFFRRDNDYGWFDPVENYEKYNPNHWMPLPKLPKDGAE